MRYKIAYLTSKDPEDVKESSGVYYYQSKALQDKCGEIEYIGPANNIFINIFKKLSSLFNKLSPKKYNSSHSIAISKIFGQIFSRKLTKGKFDFVFADKSSCEIAYLKSRIPIVYSTDATFKLLNNYYPVFSKLLNFSVKEGNLIEQKAINNSSMVICTSNWAATSVLYDYNYAIEKTYVIPRGANIDSPPDYKEIKGKKKNKICRLLFVGREWHRKGFDIAFQTMVYMRSMGVPVKLTAVGCSPPTKYIDNDVEIINYIDKTTNEGKDLFEKVMLNSDFFLLPVRAECAAIAFCESAAYGLPVITRDTGGVKEVVKNGINGYALNYKSDYLDFGDLIIDIFSTEQKYYNLVQSSRDYYEKKLNWNVWGSEMKKILDSFYDDGNTGYKNDQR